MGAGAHPTTPLVVRSDPAQPDPERSESTRTRLDGRLPQTGASSSDHNAESGFQLGHAGTSVGCGEAEGRSECGGKAQFRKLARGWLRLERRPASAIARARARELESTVLSRRDSARLRFPARYGRMSECLRLIVRNIECFRHLGTRCADPGPDSGPPDSYGRAVPGSRDLRTAGNWRAQMRARDYFFFWCAFLPARSLW